MSFNSRSLPPATPDESRRIEEMKAFGCIACSIVGMNNCGPVECHHLLSGGLRVGHRFTIPLGAYHHRGFKAHTGISGAIYGPYLVEGAKVFHAHFGSPQFLLEAIDAKIDWPTVQIPTKRRRGKTAATSKTFQHPNKRPL